MKRQEVEMATTESWSSRRQRASVRYLAALPLRSRLQRSTPLGQSELDSNQSVPRCRAPVLRRHRRAACGPTCRATWPNGYRSLN